MSKDQSSDRAKREADKAFKPATTQKPINDYAKDQNSFNDKSGAAESGAIGSGGQAGKPFRISADGAPTENSAEGGAPKSA